LIQRGLYIVCCFLLFACTKEVVQVEEITIKPPLKGYKVTARLDNRQSGTESEAKGLLSGTYNENTKVLSYKLDFEGLQPRSVKVKKGLKGVFGSQVYELPKDSLGTYCSGLQGSKKLTALQERDVIKGLWFLVIETEKYPLQEIRGQITLKSE